MERIKLLFVTSHSSKYVSRAIADFTEELRQITDLRVSYASGQVEEIVMQSDFKPDFIHIEDYMGYVGPNVTGLKELKVPFSINISDLHYQIDRKRDLLLHENVKHIFVPCRDTFFIWYPQFSRYMKWMPHHVNTNVFKDYGLEKEIDLLMIGETWEEVYPLRTAIVNRLKNRQEFVWRKHPGYGPGRGEDKEVLLGQKYAMELNRAKIAFTCDAIFKYPVKKYFEIPACNTLLLASFSRELYDLGFRPGENFVEINEYNFEEKAYDYLKNEEERNRIAFNGMQLVYQKHTTKLRAYQFVEEIKRILQSDDVSSVKR